MMPDEVPVDEQDDVPRWVQTKRTKSQQHQQRLETNPCLSYGVSRSTEPSAPEPPEGAESGGVE
jgi:hypothetical protein